MRFLIKNLSKIFLFMMIVITVNFAENMSDNDGSAFITKAEFDALKSSFQSQIDTYNQGIDSKIDDAISSYLAGIIIIKEQDLTLPTTQKIFKTFDSTNYPWVDGKHDFYRLQSTLSWVAGGRDSDYPAQQDYYILTQQTPDKQAKAAFIDRKSIGGTNRPIYMGYATNWNFVAKTLGDMDSLSGLSNMATSSNLNRYVVMRGVNTATYQNGRSSEASIKTTGTLTNKIDNIVAFNSYNPIVYVTTKPPDVFREGAYYLMPKNSAPWDITAYNVTDKLVSIYSKFVPDFCYSYTKKPNNLKYQFFDVNNADETTKQNELNKAFAEISKWNIKTQVNGWWWLVNTDASGNKVFGGFSDPVRLIAEPSADISCITPTWTSSAANSYFYGIYWPKPWSDNLYLPNTEKLWTDEYTNIANNDDFKSIVGNSNVCQYTSEGTTTNYYNMTAGLVLNYGDQKGEVTVKFKNTGANALKLYIMKAPLDVNTGYVKSNIIATNKSDTSSKNEINIPAGNTVEVTFEKEQKLVLFSFHGASGSSTLPGTIEVQDMKIKLEE